MEQQPYLRPATEDPDAAKPVPEGWVSEPAGRWRGRHVDVVYNPRRYDITFLRGEMPAKVTAGMRASGFELRSVDGPTQWWVRDRVAAARNRPHREPAAPSGLSVA